MRSVSYPHTPMLGFSLPHWLSPAVSRLTGTHMHPPPPPLALSLSPHLSLSPPLSTSLPSSWLFTPILSCRSNTFLSPFPHLCFILLFPRHRCPYAYTHSYTCSGCLTSSRQLILDQHVKRTGVGGRILRLRVNTRAGQGDSNLNETWVIRQNIFRYNF